MTDALNTLVQRLDDLHRQGQKVRFWLRDDDATVPTEALDRLIDLTARHGIPCLLAVIPALAGTALAARLSSAPHISVAVHGWSHENHAPPDQKKRELGLHRPQGVILQDLANGLTKLRTLNSTRLLPILVPPWNRIDAEIVAALGGIGFQALSVFGPEKPSSIPLMNTHVDLIDWHGNRGGRGGAGLVADILTALDAGTPDIGLLTHHLVHDPAAWDYLDRFFGLTAKHPACLWRDPAHILAERCDR